MPVLSLRTGGQIAIIDEPIIEPNNLKIEGWWVSDKFSRSRLILLSQDIRDILAQGFAINDHEVLSAPDELIRLKKVLEYDFKLPNKDVVTVGKKKIGKVSDYAVETSSMFIKKLYVNRPIIKSLSSGSLSIDRTQVIEITNKHIVIEDPLEGGKIRATEPSPAA